MNLCEFELTMQSSCAKTRFFHPMNPEDGEHLIAFAIECSLCGVRSPYRPGEKRPFACSCIEKKTFRYDVEGNYKATPADDARRDAYREALKASTTDHWFQRAIDRDQWVSEAEVYVMDDELLGLYHKEKA